MNASLLEQTQCQHILHASEVEYLLKPLLETKADLQLHKIEALDDMIRAETPHYPYAKDYELVRWDPILILHSSGSTGPPKPIIMNHATFAVGDNDRNLPTVHGRVNQNWSLWDFPQQETFFSPFPAFHLAGFSSMVLLPIYYQNAKLVMPPPTRPPTGHLVSEIMDHFKLKSIFCPPIVAEQLVQEVDGIEKCKNLKFLLYAGGPLSRAAGEALSKVTDVCQFYGQTETGAIQALVPKRDDWANLEWNPIQEVVMERYVDDAYEMTSKWPCQTSRSPYNPKSITGGVGRIISTLLPHPTSLHTRMDRVEREVMERHKSVIYGKAGSGHLAPLNANIDQMIIIPVHRNPALEKVRSLSANFPDVEVWHTKDLFKRHPTKPELWTFHGRVDDIVVLSNGEKFNPVPMEVHISAHPLVNGALIIGQGYPQPSLILEPKDNSQTLETLLDTMWHVIEEANSQAPGQARVTRDMVLISDTLKPFVRSPKGTVVRTTSGDLYKDEIAELYTRSVSKNLQHITLDFPEDLPAVSRFVADVVANVFPGHEIQPDDDLFGHGFDSLQTMELVKLLRAGIQSGNKDSEVSWINMTFVYEHSSVTELARNIHLAHIEGPPSLSKAHASETQHRDEKMRALVNKYTASLPPPLKKGEAPRHTPSGQHVILTGSTGSLGTQLLLKLVADPTVAHITCLDRSATAKDRISTALSSWRHPPTIDFARVSFHQADYSQPDFGLDPALLSTLREAATLIIHNAWKVDFNHSLHTFEAVHIRGVRNLIDFSAGSPLHPRIVFISSISSVGNWRATDEKTTNVPETLPPTLAVAQPMGYAESKAVAEHILDASGHVSGVDSLILRVGQIAGPVGLENGATWNETEWFPLLLKTAQTTSMIPDSQALGCVDWVPVDVLASAVWELATVSRADSDVSAEVFHLVNPTPRSWKELLPVVGTGLGLGSALKEVSMKEWVAELEKTTLSDKDAVAARPAVKILEFFRGVDERHGITGDGGSVFSTQAATQSSQTLRSLGPVQGEWVTKWIVDLGY